MQKEFSNHLRFPSKRMKKVFYAMPMDVTSHQRRIALNHLK
jgi:hypothetical protein